mmetsp:Transcript_27587/g.73555  ORF Transcript_27587/g.73555 Transcript_27587/m.73555 type:complete len:388 (+) Transcript_27587:50-1213(+)
MARHSAAAAAGGMAAPALALLLAALASATELGKEGSAAYADEMRLRVQANLQAVLPLPWDRIEDRDYMGFMAHLPILEGANTTSVVSEDLGSTIALVSFKLQGTDQPASPRPSVRWGAKGGKEILHYNGVLDPSSELTMLAWQKIRWAGLKAFLQAEMAVDTGKLVVISSYGDVLYGGCSEEVIMFKYNEIIAASGGTQTIVMAAEVSPWPWSLGWRYSKTNFTSYRRADVIAAYSLSNTWESSFSNCTDPAAGPCDATPKYQYANAGLIIGPVSDIYEMLQGMETYQSDVNLLANDYYLKNPGTVTLDYAGGLFLSLHNMVNNGNAPAEVQEINGTRALYSSTLGQTVCFVQGNGNGFTTLQDMANQMDSSVALRKKSRFAKWFGA